MKAGTAVGALPRVPRDCWGWLRRLGGLISGPMGLRPAARSPRAEEVAGCALAAGKSTGIEAAALRAALLPPLAVLEAGEAGAGGSSWSKKFDEAGGS